MKSTLSIILFSLLTVPALAQETKMICSINAIPAGWMIVDVIKSSSACGNKTGWKIQHLANMPVGSVVKVCVFNNPPPGWKVIQNNHCDCCGATAPGAGNQWVMKKMSNSGASEGGNGASNWEREEFCPAGRSDGDTHNKKRYSATRYELRIHWADDLVKVEVNGSEFVFENKTRDRICPSKVFDITDFIHAGRNKISGAVWDYGGGVRGNWTVVVYKPDEAPEELIKVDIYHPEHHAYNWHSEVIEKYFEIK